MPLPNRLHRPGAARVLTFTLLSDDALPAAAFTTAMRTVSEASGSAIIAVTLNRPSALTTTVSYATADGSAVSGSDYVSAAGTLTFAPNTLSAAFDLQLVNDTQLEITETLFINLSNPVNAILAVPQALTVSIVDDDPAQRQMYLPVIRK